MLTPNATIPKQPQHVKNTVLVHNTYWPIKSHRGAFRDLVNKLEPQSNSAKTAKPEGKRVLDITFWQKFTLNGQVKGLAYTENNNKHDFMNALINTSHIRGKTASLHPVSQSTKFY